MNGSNQAGPNSSVRAAAQQCWQAWPRVSQKSACFERRVVLVLLVSKQSLQAIYRVTDTRVLVGSSVLVSGVTVWSLWAWLSQAPTCRPRLVVNDT